MEVADDRSRAVDDFVVAYRATIPEVFAYLARATSGDRQLAEDLTSETYLAALAAWRGGNADAITVPWLIGVARHKLVDRFRHADREHRKYALLQAGVPADDRNAHIDRDAVMDAIRQLPPLQRAVIALRYVDDLPVRDVARSLDRSVAATDSLLRRAHTALRAILEEADL